MSKISRRKLITTGVAATAGVLGLGTAAHLAQKYGLMPPDHNGIWGVGETLTYASQRLLTRHSLAREFSRSQISKRPVPNEMPPLNDEYKRLQAGKFVDWRLAVDGLVDRPGAFSLDQLKSYPSRSQITQLACEEGWSYIAEGCNRMLDTLCTSRLIPTGGKASTWPMHCIRRLSWLMD
jgi:DMSO/TMAO reductase YedYZ molybdopterin-dependent catalytic subunit